jgi:hypothetical protein
VKIVKSVTNFGNVLIIYSYWDTFAYLVSSHSKNPKIQTFLATNAIVKTQMSKAAQTSPQLPIEIIKYILVLFFQPREPHSPLTSIYILTLEELTSN